MTTQDESGKYRKSYRKWSSMHRRCNDPKYEGYHRYGGRGIKVCPRWSGPDGYSNFVEDMAGEPPPGLTLGRKNDDLDYSPENCEWQTIKRQMEIRRPRGPVKGSLKNKAKLAGLPYMVVYLRIHTYGWSEQKALSTPKLQQGGYRGTHGKVMQAIRDEEKTHPGMSCLQYARLQAEGKHIPAFYAHPSIQTCGLPILPPLPDLPEESDLSDLSDLLVL